MYSLLFTFYFIKMNSLTFWSLVVDGGYLMIPMALLLIMSIYIFVERCIVISLSLIHISEPTRQYS